MLNEYREETSDEDMSDRHHQRGVRIYYQYHSLEDVERKMRIGEVLSGFTLKGNNEKIIISYGDGRRSSVMRCIGITRQNKGKARKCIRMAYVKCVLDEKDNDFYIQIWR